MLSTSLRQLAKQENFLVSSDILHSSQEILNLSPT
jgi:hypothetical protein